MPADLTLTERAERFALTVSQPVLEQVCVQKTGYFKFAPEDSYACLKTEPRLVQHYRFLGGLFSYDLTVQSPPYTTLPNDFRSGGRLR